MIKLKQLLIEKTVRLSTMKDANFVPGQWVQIVGKKGMVKLDKKDVKYLAKWIRNNSGKHGMGWSFTEDKVDETKKRDYKAEYKKYGSSTKAKKYRAELNAYNRKKGTYGNGDGKDASHKGGKIVGFEAESKNRGRAEKSRLKKEGKLNEGKTLTLPNGVKVTLDFKGVTFKARKGAPVFLDRDELLKFFRGSTKYLRYT